MYFPHIVHIPSLAKFLILYASCPVHAHIYHCTLQQGLSAMQKNATREPLKVLARSPPTASGAGSNGIDMSTILAQRGNLKAAASNVSARTASLPKKENVMTNMLVGIRGFKKDTLSKCAKQTKSRGSTANGDGKVDLFSDLQAGSSASLSRALAERFRLCQMGDEDEDETVRQAWLASP